MCILQGAALEQSSGEEEEEGETHGEVDALKFVCFCYAYDKLQSLQTAVHFKKYGLFSLQKTKKLLKVKFVPRRGFVIAPVKVLHTQSTI